MTLAATTGPTPTGGGSGQIVFAAIKSDVAQLYVMDIYGSEPVQITDMKDGACQPVWSPDGMKIAFISPCRGMEDQYFNSSIFIINADGTELQQLSNVPGGDFEPAWSPDGTKIAFTSLRTEKMEVFVTNLADQTVTQLTDRPTGETSRQPAWSPDGTQIVYAVQRFGVNQIWLMTSAGENEKQIVRSGTTYTDYQPVWSRDGKLILFNQRRADIFSLPYLMSIEAVNSPTEQGTRVPLNVLPIENVEYSPDGFWLIYEGDNRDILFMTVTGAGRTLIDTGKGPAFDPAWRPIVK